MHFKNEQIWVLKKTQQILRESGVKTARRFIESRGGPARHESASRLIAQVAIEQLAKAKALPKTK